MLEKLIQIGEQTYSFSEEPFGKIDKSCCPETECKIIDFDKVKEVVIQKHSLNSLSSCDGLKICLQENILDFIEMKGFQEFKARNHDLHEEIIERQINKFDFQKKIQDSLYVLETIIRSGVFCATKKDREKFNKCTKRYFIVTDIEDKQDGLASISFNLDFLATTSNIDHTIRVCLENKVESMDDICFLVQKPRIVSCNDICHLLCKGI